MSSPAHVVVLGAGFAGLAAVKALRKARHVRVTLVDRTNHHLFQPLLYQVASAALNPSEIAAATRAVLATGNPEDFPMPSLDVQHWPVGQ